MQGGNYHGDSNARTKATIQRIQKEPPTLISRHSCHGDCTGSVIRVASGSTASSESPPHRRGLGRSRGLRKEKHKIPGQRSSMDHADVASICSQFARPPAISRGSVSDVSDKPNQKVPGLRNGRCLDPIKKRELDIRGDPRARRPGSVSSLPPKSICKVGVGGSKKTGASTHALRASDAPNTTRSSKLLVTTNKTATCSPASTSEAAIQTKITSNSSTLSRASFQGLKKEKDNISLKINQDSGDALAPIISSSAHATCRPTTTIPSVSQSAAKAIATTLLPTRLPGRGLRKERGSVCLKTNGTDARASGTVGAPTTTTSRIPVLESEMRATANTPSPSRLPRRGIQKEVGRIALKIGSNHASAGSTATTNTTTSSTSASGRATRAIAKRSHEFPAMVLCQEMWEQTGTGVPAYEPATQPLEVMTNTASPLTNGSSTTHMNAAGAALDAAAEMADSEWSSLSQEMKMLEDSLVHLSNAPSIRTLHQVLESHQVEIALEESLKAMEISNSCALSNNHTPEDPLQQLREEQMQAVARRSSGCDMSPEMLERMNSSSHVMDLALEESLKESRCSFASSDWEEQEMLAAAKRESLDDSNRSREAGQDEISELLGVVQEILQVARGTQSTIARPKGGEQQQAESSTKP